MIRPLVTRHSATRICTQVVGRSSRVPKVREIRAMYDERLIRVYQAYSDVIAEAALLHGRFVSPPFKMDRMTWIKPSFLWMMYRAGWGRKDDLQRRLLAIDVTREGFEWALSHATLSHDAAARPDGKTQSAKSSRKPLVRVQWDPERNLFLQPLEYRSIQIGLRGQAIERYIRDWTVAITDVTAIARDISNDIESGDLETAARKLPREEPYPLSSILDRRIGASSPHD